MFCVFGSYLRLFVSFAICLGYITIGAASAFYAQCTVLYALPWVCICTFVVCALHVVCGTQGSHYHGCALVPRPAAARSSCYYLHSQSHVNTAADAWKEKAAKQCRKPEKCLCSVMYVTPVVYAAQV